MKPGKIMKVNFEDGIETVKVIKNCGKNAWDNFTEDFIDVEILDGPNKGEIRGIWMSDLKENKT